MNRKRNFIILISLFVIMVLLCICFTIKSARASDGIYREKCVISIRIEEGDTLWSIASQYYTVDYCNINDLINEIKKTNHIDDTVFIGQYIIVPYYREIS